MLINFQFDAAKLAPNTKRHNFALINWKAKVILCINYAFQKICEIH